MRIILVMLFPLLLFSQKITLDNINVKLNQNIVHITGYLSKNDNKTKIIEFTRITKDKKPRIYSSHILKFGKIDTKLYVIPGEYLLKITTKNIKDNTIYIKNKIIRI